ncbi:MAG: hypothetical protein ACKOB4_06605 [Acidobacteriota bacterium]
MKRYTRQIMLLLFMLLIVTEPLATVNDEKAIRGAIQRYFLLLKTGRYGQLYDSLPAAFQKQATREEIAGSLGRLGEFLKLERIEISQIEQRGDIAVASTTILGALTRPITINNREIRQGRVSSRQYLIRENRVWKIASANERSLRAFMKDHPEVETLFPQTLTRFELLSDGKWIRMPGSR